MITGAIVLIGNNPEIIWEFGAGILGIYLSLAILTMGIEAIRRFLNDV